MHPQGQRQSHTLIEGKDNCANPLSIEVHPIRCQSNNWGEKPLPMGVPRTSSMPFAVHWL